MNTYNKWMQHAGRCILVLLLIALAIPSSAQKEIQEYYQIRVYHFSDLSQQTAAEQYLSSDFVPAMHKNGFKNIGVFTPVGNDTAADKKIYVFMAASSLEKIVQPSLYAGKDTAGAYTGAAFDKIPYLRFETVLLKAFPLAKKMNLPKLSSPKSEHVYELRSYESPTEKYYKSKVKMFNQGGEIALFSRLNFNAVFYSDVLSGSRMPNLMYMTSFENMEDRDAHWKSFGNSPEWKTLSALPEYQHNVSKADIMLLKALPCSDF